MVDGENEGIAGGEKGRGMHYTCLNRYLVKRTDCVWSVWSYKLRCLI